MTEGLDVAVDGTVDFPTMEEIGSLSICKAFCWSAADMPVGFVEGSLPMELPDMLIGLDDAMPPAAEVLAGSLWEPGWWEIVPAPCVVFILPERVSCGIIGGLERLRLDVAVGVVVVVDADDAAVAPSEDGGHFRYCLKSAITCLGFELTACGGVEVEAIECNGFGVWI